MATGTNPNPMWGAAAGTASNIAGGMLANRMNRRNTKDYMQWQHSQNLSMLEANKKAQMQMWEDTNYKAQIEQLKKAGLNPGLIYGSAGEGGSTNVGTGGMGTGPGGGNAPNMGGMELGQAMMMKKQQELIDAEIRLKDAQAEKTKGVDTELGEAQINDIVQTIRNKKTQEAGQRLDNALQEINIFEMSESQEDRMLNINYNTRKALKELKILENDAEISTETKESIINITKQNLINARLQSTLNISQNSKLQKEIEKLTVDIQKIGKDMDKIDHDMLSRDIDTAIKKWVENNKAEYPSLMNVGGMVLNETLKGIIWLMDAVTGTTHREPRQQQMK